MAKRLYAENRTIKKSHWQRQLPHNVNQPLKKLIKVQKTIVAKLSIITINNQGIHKPKRYKHDINNIKNGRGVKPKAFRMQLN